MVCMKHTILIVDDVEVNRLMLETILSPYYNILMAADGRETLNILNERHDEIYAVLLDLIMPVCDGITLLKKIHNEPWFVNTAFIVVTIQDSIASERQCFELGVTDFIHKPYDSALITKRVENTVRLVEYQRDLQKKIQEQTGELLEQNRKLTEYAEILKSSRKNIVNLLGSVVESRNAESGEHIFRVRKYTEILCKYVADYYPEYQLNAHSIEEIVSASPLHDIGKIAIPDSILLKEGKLSTIEYELMKQHTVLGSEIIENSENTFEESFKKVASEICLYHHERYDGNGYPKGLKGNVIPISAQIVSVADAYDALVHHRIYKEAYSAEDAFHMISDGECGVFNPKLIRCLSLARKEFEEVK